MQSQEKRFVLNFLHLEILSISHLYSPRGSADRITLDLIAHLTLKLAATCPSPAPSTHRLTWQGSILMVWLNSFSKEMNQAVSTQINTWVVTKQSHTFYSKNGHLSFFRHLDAGSKHSMIPTSLTTAESNLPAPFLESSVLSLQFLVVIP